MKFKNCLLTHEKQIDDSQYIITTSIAGQCLIEGILLPLHKLRHIAILPEFNVFLPPDLIIDIRANLFIIQLAHIGQIDNLVRVGYIEKVHAPLNWDRKLLPSTKCFGAILNIQLLTSLKN